ncbi:KEOPS complex N(6)-L-threonylcarbamoyladenine synthase Kae1 [Thermogladius sp. 4427co]|uniref:KEOPS complex N(6)-L-threonylcarbamoyladenine synthase Kae1 n=1 Tax=Thermogladius sp. 4427co TaxID=3450718 RepID=UPI003F78B898
MSGSRQLYRIPFPIPEPEDRNLIVLGVESTSHTLGIGVVVYKGNGLVEIASNIRKVYTPSKGGIHPREAANTHIRNAKEAIEEALTVSGFKLREVDAVAVALGPGLGPCIRVGATIARFISSYLDKKLVPVNHAVAHVEIGKLVTGLADPLIIYVSGGNTMIVAGKQGYYRVYGETLDIPLGNLFDTFTREVGIAPPYIVEGRHAIDICSEWGRDFIPLPYVVKGNDLSFSGLLTAALSVARKYAKSDRKKLGDVCLSLRETAFNMLVEVAERVLLTSGKKSILLVGGVASNIYLNTKLELMASEHGVVFRSTPTDYSGDNGAMIAYTGLLNYLYGVTVEPLKAYVRQRWRIDEVEIPWMK